MKTISGIFLVVALSACVQSERRTQNHDVRLLEPRVSSVVEHINRCPPWASLKREDSNQVQNLLRCLSDLSREETVVLRDGVRLFVDSKRNTSAYTVDEMSKLFLLNRYLFDVPARFKTEGPPTFGGWLGIPSGENWIDLLWPLGIANDGNLMLRDYFRGYSGPDFPALEEFDAFAKSLAAADSGI